jgi:glutamyl-tRNA reductase
MRVTVVGLSHKTAPVEQREKASLSRAEAQALVRELSESPHITEAAALSTCNRTEVYAASDDLEAAEAAIVASLVKHSRIASSELSCARYTHRDEHAVSQLFRVASSLDSMVVGESEIQGQVRAAWQLAGDEGAIGPVLNQLFRRALETGKRVRTDTHISSGPGSVSAVAVNLACEAFPDLETKRVLIIGAGKMAEGTMRNFVDSGLRDVVVVNRTVGTARDLAERVGGRGVGFDHLDDELREADIVISSTDAPHTILDRARLEPVFAARAGRTMFIIDISVPRDIDPAIADMPGVELHDIDDLERVVEANLNGRRAEALIGEGLVSEAVADFVEWRQGLAATPAIRSLRDHAEAIRAREIERVSAGWEMSDADRERVNALTKAIVNKILHEPTVRARAAAGEAEGLRHLESLRHLFGLEAPVDNAS